MPDTFRVDTDASWGIHDPENVVPEPVNRVTVSGTVEWKKFALDCNARPYVIFTLRVEGDEQNKLERILVKVRGEQASPVFRRLHRPCGRVLVLGSLHSWWKKGEKDFVLLEVDAKTVLVFPPSDPEHKEV